MSTVEAEIAHAEDCLRTAMLRSDLSALDRLLAPGLMFTNHLGQLLGKEDDLAAHRSGALRIEELKTIENDLRIIGGTAIVTVRMKVTGTYNGSPASGDFRFTRVWIRSENGAWQVAAAHASMLA